MDTDSIEAHGGGCNWNRLIETGLLETRAGDKESKQGKESLSWLRVIDENEGRNKRGLFE